MLQALILHLLLTFIFHQTLQLQASDLQAMAAQIFREDNCSTLYYRAEAAESETSDFIEDFDEDSI